MEVIEVDLASGLKFVDKIEEAEGKYCARLDEGGREPLDAKKLDSSAARWLKAVAVTKAVFDPHGLHTRDIKKREVNGLGGKETSIANAMTELVSCAQVKKGLVGEEFSIPLLRENTVSGVKTE